MHCELYLSDDIEICTGVGDIRNGYWDLQGFHYISGSDSSGPWSAIFTNDLTQDSEMIIKDYLYLDTITTMKISRNMATKDYTSLAEPSGILKISQITGNFEENDTSENIVFQEKVSAPWQVMDPIKLYPGICKIKITYTPLSNAVSCSLGGIHFYRNKKLNCSVSTYKPPKPSGTLSEINLLRGFTRYQQTKLSGTEINISVMFQTYAEYQEFIVNSQKKPFVFKDKDGIYYRGAIAPDSFDGEYFGELKEGYFFRDVKLLCGQQLGMGW